MLAGWSKCGGVQCGMVWSTPAKAQLDDEKERTTVEHPNVDFCIVHRSLSTLTPRNNGNDCDARGDDEDENDANADDQNADDHNADANDGVDFCAILIVSDNNNAGDNC